MAAADLRTKEIRGLNWTIIISVVAAILSAGWVAGRISNNIDNLSRQQMKTTTIIEEHFKKEEDKWDKVSDRITGVENNQTELKVRITNLENRRR